jgi:protein SCO1
VFSLSTLIFGKRRAFNDNSIVHHIKYPKRALILSAVLLVSLIASSCRPETSTAQRHELKGKVVSVEKDKHIVTVAHESIKDFMEGMTMPFTVRDDWPFEVLAPGDQITATLVIDGPESWLENVIVSKSSSETTPLSSSGATEAQPGDTVPDFTLVNQNNRTIRTAQYRGKALLLTFIYTRCPIPEYCTLMSNNFAEIDRELQKTQELYEKTRLLSISIDPEYDTPAVLRSYGSSHTGRYEDEKFTHWEFATGRKEEVKEVAKFFGLQYFPEKDQIVHGLRTVIVGPDGKVVKVYRGNEWKPSEVVKELEALLK